MRFVHLSSLISLRRTVLLAGAFSLFTLPGQKVLAVDGAVAEGEFLTQPASFPAGLTLDQPPLPPLAPIVARAKSNPFVYGLYAWTGEYFQHLGAIRQVGWRAFRLGGPWDDEVMRRLVQDDVSISRGVGAKAKTDPDPAGDEALLQEHQANITRFVERYGPGGTFFKEHAELPSRPIQYVEAWNEPNFEYLIRPDKRPRKEQEASREALYAKILPKAYQTVQAHNPQVKFIGFSTGGADAGDTRFIKHVLDLDPKIVRDFDLLSTHPYVNNAPPECYDHVAWGKYGIASGLDTIRQTLVQHGRTDTPVWYTEVGWQISGQDGGKYKKPGVKATTPELQAAYTCRLYAYAQRLGVERVTNMFVVDTDGYNGGFFLPDGTWRPSAHAVQTMIHLMPAPKLLEAVSDGDGGYFAYRFSPGPTPAAEPVLMLWNVAGPRNVEVAVQTVMVKIVDMLGHEKKVSATAGKINVAIGPLPVYLVPLR